MPILEVAAREGERQLRHDPACRSKRGGRSRRRTQAGTEDYAIEVLAHEIGHHVLAPANAAIITVCWRASARTCQPWRRHGDGRQPVHRPADQRPPTAPERSADHLPSTNGLGAGAEPIRQPGVWALAPAYLRTIVAAGTRGSGRTGGRKPVQYPCLARRAVAGARICQ